MSADLSPPAGSIGPSRRSDRSPWNYLLLVPIATPLLTFLYNSETPRLFGIPFFYWFQMLLAPLAVLASVSTFYLSRRPRSTRSNSARSNRARSNSARSNSAREG
jgi:CBS domain containing-hemolysin-like protein